jgi:hypothetical protein
LRLKMIPCATKPPERRGLDERQRRVQDFLLDRRRKSASTETIHSLLGSADRS